MIDTRNEYKAMPTPNYRTFWSVYYRYWWSPFWSYLGAEPSIEEARDRCIRHATGTSDDPRKPVYFGRLP